MKTILSASLLFLSTLNYAQNIGINGSGANAHPSALLDIDASSTPSLGILIPRIALEATNLAAPISSPAISLLVYNTATVISGPTSVVPGYYYWDGTKWVRFQYTSSTTQDWGLTGNSGTTAGTNFIGTTDNQDLVFKRNNVQAGLLNYALNSTSFGIEALNPNNTGVNNTSLGYQSMQRNTSGNFNTATGAYGLQNNLSGNSNTADGFYALWLNTTGDQNTAIGFATLANNISGVSNTAIGFESLNGNTGNDNTGIGLTSLYLNSTGNRNNAIGLSALYSNTTANDNTAVGYSSMFNNTTGFGNVSVGNVSGTNNITGSKNTFIGYGANATTGALTNATAIGNNAQVGQSNALILGGTGADAVKVGIGTTTPKSEFEVFESSGLSEIRISSSTQAKYGELIFSSSNPSYLDRGASIEGNGEGTGIDVGALLFKTQYGATLRTERMRISSMGNVGIGTASPVYKLDVQGTTACAGNVWTSDKRKKQNIQPLALNGLDVINKLKPVTYEWKQVLDNGMKGTQIGFIAQELEEILPSMVVTANNEEQSKAVKYNELLPILVKAIQELGKENLELKKITEQQQKQIEILLSK